MLRREADGILHDISEGRRVSASELRQDVRDGRQFRVEDSRTGTDCTFEVLAEVVWGVAPAGQSGGGLGGVTNLLSGLGSMQGLADVTVRRLLDRADETDFWDRGRRGGNSGRREPRRRRSERAPVEPPDPDAADG